MKLILIREPSVAGKTFGASYLDEAFECFSLEDEIRAYPHKIPKRTAIWGDRTYEVAMNYSPKFGRIMPRVIGVVLFEGIRIHLMKNQDWTEGCIGFGRINIGLELRGYDEAFATLFPKLEAAVARVEKIWITIVNPVEQLEPEGVKAV